MEPVTYKGITISLKDKDIYKNRLVTVNKEEQGTYLVELERNAIDEDKPALAEVKDGKLITKLYLTSEALHAIAYMYAKLRNIPFEDIEAELSRQGINPKL